MISKGNILAWASLIYKAISGNGSPKSIKPPDLNKEKLENMLIPVEPAKKIEESDTPFIQLPKKMIGVYHFLGNDPAGRDSWGMPETINMLVELGKILANENLELGIGDISLKFPGLFTDAQNPRKLSHVSHRNGNDIDVRPARVDRKRLPCSWKSKFYDRIATELIINSAAEVGFKLILFNDIMLCEKYNFVRSARGHDNHLHLRRIV